MTPEIYEIVRRAASDVDYVARDWNCECPPQEGYTVEAPVCHDRHLQRALIELEKIETPAVETMHPERLTTIAERTYFEEAQKLAKREPAINGGWSSLELILNPNLSERPPAGYSHRDALVIGTPYYTFHDHGAGI